MTAPIKEWRRARAQRAIRQLMGLGRPLTDRENEQLAEHFRTAYGTLVR